MIFQITGRLCIRCGDYEILIKPQGPEDTDLYLDFPACSWLLPVNGVQNISLQLNTKIKFKKPSSTFGLN
jgi:hypothetical protein